MRLFQIDKISSDLCGNESTDKTFFVESKSILEICNSIPGKVTGYEKNGKLVKQHNIGSGGWGTWEDNPSFKPTSKNLNNSTFINKNIGLGSLQIREVQLSSLAEIK